MEVYTFRGNEGEEVPKNVEKLIVNRRVQVLPEKFCEKRLNLREVTLPKGLVEISMWAFIQCENLLEITIHSAVQIIVNAAFFRCRRLKKVNFEFSSCSPHQLHTVGRLAFDYCYDLPRIKLPSSVNSVGLCAFADCWSLVEADLSTTGINEVYNNVFNGCRSLQTVSLPNTVERILIRAFYGCFNLVTLAVPLDSRPIQIGELSFWNCRQLANVVLPKHSTAHESSFDKCRRLHNRYGEDSSHILAGLIGRFENFCIHLICYDQSTFTAEELRHFIEDEHGEDWLIDESGMTPFHVFFSAAEPRTELLHVLLDLLPNDLVNWEDANGWRPLDYLIRNWTDHASYLLKKTLQKWMIDRVTSWGATSWAIKMENKIHAVLAEEGEYRRVTLYNEVYTAWQHCEKTESTSILEMALWKKRMRSGWADSGVKRQALDRAECRYLSGANVVIPSVTAFLPRILRPDEDLSEGEDSFDEEDYAEIFGF